MAQMISRQAGTSRPDPKLKASLRQIAVFTLTTGARDTSRAHRMLSKTDTMDQIGSCTKCEGGAKLAQRGGSVNHIRVSYMSGRRVVTTANLFVVDDEESVLESVKAVLAMYGYNPRCFLTGEEFLENAALEQAGCVITDLQMPGIDGIRLQQRLIEMQSPLSVIVLSGTADVPTVVNVMRKGAFTLLEKPYSGKDLATSVQSALDASERYFQKLQTEKRVRGLIATLTDEERMVMKQMLAGVPNKNMASVMDIGMRTVDRRRQAVFTKMGASTIAELATLLNSASIDLETLE